MNNKIIMFLLIVCFSFLLMPVRSMNIGFSPEKYPSDKDFGIGAYFAPKTITIYEEPDLNSHVKEILSWNYAHVQIDSQTESVNDPNQVFLVFYPFKEIAVMAVSDEVKDWAEVIYDQENKLKGWVYLREKVKKTQYNTFAGNFYTWYDFMVKIAKPRGLYFLPGVPSEAKKLRGTPSKEAKPIPMDFTYIRSINMKHIRGNWVLVKVVDITDDSPYGWVRWRDDKGKLMIFCDLK